MHSDYGRIEAAISFIQEHVRSQPGLEEVASHVGLSPFYFQRLFRRWAGISPKRFLEFLTVEYAKQRLELSETILDTSLDLGLSGPARLHDQFVAIEAVTPGEYKRRGQNIEIAYGIYECPFGEMFVAQTRRGVCMLSFLSPGRHETELETLQSIWKNATIYEDRLRTALTMKRIFPRNAVANGRIHLIVHGTNFQINVWRALLRIPEGCAVSYRQLATYLGKPSTTRAVANAVAANPIGYLIPCHRVIRNNGLIGGYRWGSTRKKIMLAWESARTLGKGGQSKTY